MRKSSLLVLKLALLVSYFRFTASFLSFSFHKYQHSRSKKVLSKENDSIENNLPAKVQMRSSKPRKSRRSIFAETDPRSLFGSLGENELPVPVTYNISQGELVNRHVQLRMIWKTWISNLNTDISEKKTLVVTGQMFGTGKTTFGRNILNWNNAHVLAEFEKLEDSIGKKQLQRALTVYIDLQNLNLSPDSLSTRGVTEYFSLLIWTSTLEQCFGIDIVPAIVFWKKSVAENDSMRNVQGVIKMLSRLTDRIFYFHFDEINALESEKFSGLFHTSSSTEGVDIALRRYYLFWDSISGILDKSFVYVSGKTTRITEVGLGKLGQGKSPSRCLQLYLPRLSRSDINDVIKVKYAESFCTHFDENQVHKVAGHIFRWSSGIPRVMEFAIKFILSLSSPADFLSSYCDAFDGEVRRLASKPDEFDNSLFTGSADVVDMDAVVLGYLVGNVPGLIPDFRVLKEPNKSLLSSVLHACACEISFSSDYVFDNGMSAADISELFSVYTSTCQSGPESRALTFFLPLTWKYYLKKNRSKLRHLPFELIHDLNPYTSDKGSAFEELTIGMILMHFAFSPRGVVPFLAETSSCVLHRDLSDLHKSTIYRMQSRVYSRNNSIDMLNYSPDHSFIAKSVKADSFVDFMLLYKMTPGEHIRRLIGFQCKAEVANMGAGDVKIEIRKFVKFVELSRSIGKPSRSEILLSTALFVLILSGRGTEEVENLRGRVWSSDDKEVKSLSIPSGLQVLILSHDQVEELVLSVNLDIIKTLWRPTSQ